MFVNFSNEEDRNKAISRIDGYDLKGKKLKAFVAQASKDPLKKIRENSDTKVRYSSVLLVHILLYYSPIVFFAKQHAT